MKTFCRFIAGMLVLAMLVACATGYGRKGLTGGYGESKIDDSHYIVYFDGNGYASKDRVWYFWIYRCAQLTKERGYEYFAVEPMPDALKKTAFDRDDEGGRLIPAVAGDQDRGQLIKVRGGGGGGGGHVTYMPGVVGGGAVTSWHSKAVVAMYGNDIPAKTIVLRAQLVLDALTAYVKSDGSSAPPEHSAIYAAAAFALAPDSQLVNVHQYMLAHPAAQPAPSLARATPNWLGPPPTTNRPPLLAQQASASPPRPLPPSPPPTTPIASVAQGVADHLGCGAVQANGNATYVAPCGSYSVLISCEDDHCRPLHTIEAKDNGGQGT